jgi:hypothetical protein
MLKWLKRNFDARAGEDSHHIDNVEYNSMAGAKKIVEVGPALEYVGATTVATKVNPGDQLYIFNAGALGYIAMGEDNTVSAAVAPGEDAFPCLPNQFTVYSAADYNWIIGSADLHLYVLRDESRARVNKSDR